MEFQPKDSDNTKPDIFTGKEKRTVSLSAFNKIAENQEQQKLEAEPLRVNIDELQPKVDRLNKLMQEKNPKTPNEQFDLFKTIDFTIEEVIWMNVSIAGKMTQMTSFLSQTVKIGAEILQS